MHFTALWNIVLQREQRKILNHEQVVRAACENSRLFSLLAAREVSSRGTSAPWPCCKPYITLVCNIRKKALISLFWNPNGLNEWPEMCFEFPFKLIDKSTMTFLTVQSWRVLKSCNMKWDHFEILARGRSDTYCKIKKTANKGFRTFAKRNVSSDVF